MAKAKSSAILNHSADDVWHVVGGFNNLPSWHPAFRESDLQSSTNSRMMVLADGSPLVERLETFDNAGRMMRYSITQTELPITSYLGTLRVTPDGAGKCKIEWFAEFDAEPGKEDEMREVLENVYTAGFEAVDQRLSG